MFIIQTSSRYNSVRFYKQTYPTYRRQQINPQKKKKASHNYHNRIQTPHQNDSNFSSWFLGTTTAVRSYAADMAGWRRWTLRPETCCSCTYLLSALFCCAFLSSSLGHFAIKLSRNVSQTLTSTITLPPDDKCQSNFGYQSCTKILVWSASIDGFASPPRPRIINPK